QRRVLQPAAQLQMHVIRKNAEVTKQVALRPARLCYHRLDGAQHFLANLAPASLMHEDKVQVVRELPVRTGALPGQFHPAAVNLISSTPCSATRPSSWATAATRPPCRRCGGRWTTRSRSYSRRRGGPSSRSSGASAVATFLQLPD